MKILHYCTILLCIVALGGCGKGNANTPAAIDPATGKHATPGWAIPDATTGTPPHASASNGYFALPNSCRECHGEDFSGGISKVACFKCHLKPFPHGDGFDLFNASNVSPHATSAKSAVGVKAGMAYCAKCHGSEYNSANAKSCIACHKLANPTITTNAPHAANWATYLKNARNLNHSTVDVSNAPACAHCHAKKANLSDTGKSRVAGFLTPGPSGCFDNSLCHNQAGHTFKVFDTPAEPGHMIPARSNLLFCQSCHADPATGSNPRYNKKLGTGVLKDNGCEGCHTQPGIAHPYIWLPGRGSQPGTNHGNAQNLLAACGLCHGGNTLAGGPGYTPAWVTGSAIAPSCFSATGLSISGTTCHFSAPANPVSGAPLLCSSCHGNPPDGTSFPNTANRHTVHWALSGISTNGGCDVCHSGAGTGTVKHADGFVNTTSFSDKFRNAPASAAKFQTTGAGAGKCTNISCHGGRVFPTQTWTSADHVLNPLDSASCLLCHRVSTLVPANIVGTPSPYIGPFSGNNLAGGSILGATNLAATSGSNLHKAHPAFNTTIVCMDCHNLSVHFNSVMQGRRTLNSGFAAASVGGSGTKVSSYTYNGPTSSSCSAIVAGCHPNDAPGSTRSWYTTVIP